MPARAKFRCQSVAYSQDPAIEGPRLFTFTAVYDDTIPEDQRFSRYTPFGEVKMTVDNPEIKWTPGTSYYFDITEAPAL